MPYEIVWRVSDRARLERQVELACARAGLSKRASAAWLKKFFTELKSHPLEWPSSSLPPSEHAWSFGRLRVRYRLIPDAQIVEVVSITES